MSWLYVPVAHADVKTLLGNINRVIINPIIMLLFALALVYFLYGLLKFIMNADQASAKEEGKQHMIYGVIGMFIMLSAFTIIRIVTNSFGIDVDLPR